MTAETLLAKLLSLYIWETYQVELTYAQILSRREVLVDEYYHYVKEARKWLEVVEEVHLTIRDSRLTPGGMYKYIMEYSKKYGTWEESEDGGKTYHKEDPEETVLIVLDHIFLINGDSGAETGKLAVDKASSYLVTIRNKTMYSPVVIQQMNRNSSSMDRRNADMQEPELQDLKGSSNTSEDCEVALALFSPFREKMSKYRGYDVSILRDNFRSIVICKNRYGEVAKMVPVNFHGSVGLFKPMPKGDDIPVSKYYLYQHLQPEEKEVEENETSTFQWTL